MNNVPKELIEEATRRGIVPGATVLCALSDRHGTVVPIGEWHSSKESETLWVGNEHKSNGGSLCGKSFSGKWATVINPAPSEEGLKEGDACECSPAMRDAILQRAIELGCGSETYTPNEHKAVVYRKKEVNSVYPLKKWSYHDQFPTGEIPVHEFLRRLEATAPKVKPILIGNDEVKFNKGSIQVGCTRIENATVKAIAEKLIDA